MFSSLTIHSFSAQLAYLREPALRATPLVIVPHDRPQAKVAWACERARAAGILPGMRYAQALAICDELRARQVGVDEIAAATNALRTALHALSPRVEPGEAGTFWLDGAGLQHIFPTPTAWAHAIRAAVERGGLEASIAVGWSRFATYAIARAQRRGLVLLATEAEERARAAAVPLARLDLAPALRDSLGKLGVTTLGQLLALPASSLLERYGREAHALRELAGRERWDPIAPVAPPELIEERVVLDDEETDAERLTAALAPSAQRLLLRHAKRGHAIRTLHVELMLKYSARRSAPRVESITVHEPTTDPRVLLPLATLRLANRVHDAPVTAMRIWADPVPATPEQLALVLAVKPRRDLRKANEAIEKIRAELGDDAVLRPVRREAHLPEARVCFERLPELVAAKPEAAPRSPPLVRRIFRRPIPLPRTPRSGRDGWLIAGLARGPVVHLDGPYHVSGGWWVREVRREYYYAETQRGDCLWVFYDRVRNRWYWQGCVQ